MARIAGVDLPREKRVEIGLTYVYGIGRVSANKILEKAKENPDTRVRELTDDEVKRIVGVLTRFDTLCNDLASGLPAEIEARQKQYEYYRDKLLTFKEASV